MKYAILIGIFLYLFFLQMTSVRAEEVSLELKAQLFLERGAICSGDQADCLREVAAEIAECEKAGSAKCQVRYTTGQFTVAPGYLLLDTNCDGVREIVDKSYPRWFRWVNSLFSLGVEFSPHGWCVSR